MLATHPLPASPFNTLDRSEDATQYRPVKDLKAFNAILPPAIEFVEGSSSGSLAVVDAGYEPINGTPKAAPITRNSSRPSSPSPSARQVKTPRKKITELHIAPLETSWPANFGVGAGLHNLGNTCFLNSALQCLIHTPALVRVIVAHGHTEPCTIKGVCMSCNFRSLMVKAFKQNHSLAPYDVVNKLQYIAKHMRKGRQEDSHEFLRYMIDALQKSCLAGVPLKSDPKLAETTWVHKLFGGRLRSRVHCRSCGHNSDTFDRVLDLSVDISQADSLRDTLKQFVAIDVLKGADKYKCEKCKKPVIAEKRFTIHEAPLVLTIHLKRFSPLGRKIGHLVRYGEQISLEPYMSEDAFGPTYSLYGVISHAGGGPHSGHYLAHVKAGDGRWYEMNDDSVQRVHAAPTDRKSAYVLFYVRERGQALEAALNAGVATTSKASNTLLPPAVMKAGIATAMKKRKISAEDGEQEAQEAKTLRKSAVSPPPKKKAFIGPQLPSDFERDASLPKSPAVAKPDPQATALEKKIAVAKAAAAAVTPKASPLAILIQYEDSDEEDIGESLGELPKPALTRTALASPVATVPPTSFYSSGASQSQLQETSSPTPFSFIEKGKGKVLLPRLPKPKRFSDEDAAKAKIDDHDASDSDDYVEASSTALSGEAMARVRQPLPSRGRRQSGHGHLTLGTGVHRGRPSYGAGNPYSKVKGSNNLHDRRSPNKRPLHKYGRHNRRF